MHIPDFSAIGRILAMYPSGSANSSHEGSNTGHSGGGINSSPASIALKEISEVRFEGIHKALININISSHAGFNISLIANPFFICHALLSINMLNKLIGY